MSPLVILAGVGAIAFLAMSRSDSKTITIEDRVYKVSHEGYLTRVTRIGTDGKPIVSVQYDATKGPVDVTVREGSDMSDREVISAHRALVADVSANWTMFEVAYLRPKVSGDVTKAWYYQELWSCDGKRWTLKQKIGPEKLWPKSNDALFPFGSPDPTYITRPLPFYLIRSFVWNPNISKWTVNFERNNWQTQSSVSGCMGCVDIAVKNPIVDHWQPEVGRQTVHDILQKPTKPSYLLVPEVGSLVSRKTDPIYAFIRIWLWNPKARRWSAELERGPVKLSGTAALTKAEQKVRVDTTALGRTGRALVAEVWRYDTSNQCWLLSTRIQNY